MKTKNLPSTPYAAGDVLKSANPKVSSNSATVRRPLTANKKAALAKPRKKLLKTPAKRGSPVRGAGS